MERTLYFGLGNDRWEVTSPPRPTALSWYVTGYEQRSTETSSEGTSLKCGYT